jgi:hypothetical protein
MRKRKVGTQRVRHASLAGHAIYKLYSCPTYRSAVSAGLTAPLLLPVAASQPARTQDPQTTTAPGPSEGPGAAARSSGRGQEPATRGGFQGPKNRWLSLRQLLANGGALVCWLAGLRKLIKQGVVRPSSIMSTSVVATVYWCVIFASDFLFCRSQGDLRKLIYGRAPFLPNR